MFCECSFPRSERNSRRSLGLREGPEQTISQERDTSLAVAPNSITGKLTLSCPCVELLCYLSSASNLASSAPRSLGTLRNIPATGAEADVLPSQ